MPGRLLIVDDHPRFRATARRMLESEGWTVLAEAETGAGALRETDRVQPDVVLLDVGLPDGSGIDFARALCASHPGLAVRLLEDAGMEVVGEAGDAEELLRKVRAHRPDVAIIDIRMPPDHLDEGLQAAEVIRRELPETGVLMLSQTYGTVGHPDA